MTPTEKYHKWRAMWDNAGGWDPTRDDIQTLLAHIDHLTDDRDALLAMVECCRELVGEFVNPVKRNNTATARALHEELAEIVGYPPKGPGGA